MPAHPRPRTPPRVIARRLATLLLALCLPRGAALAALPPARPVPGGIARIDLGAATDPLPVALFGTHRVLVVADRGRAIALVGLPLAQAPGPAVLTVGGPEGSSRRFVVASHAYPTQRLSVAPKHVDLSAEDLARYEDERRRLGAILDSYDEARLPDFPLAAPVSAPRTPTFGSRRVFNGQARDPHSGMDLPVPTGTPVLSPAAGVVAEVHDYFFNGLTIVVDHGHGVMSLVCHLSRADVAIGAPVARGTPLGLSGATGRVTGPHLHFAVSLNHAFVDPTLVLGDGS